MAILTAHMTKLDAVNDMLLSIGETPVQSLDSGLADAALAEEILDRKNREIQLIGWAQNTYNGYALTRNNDNQIPVPANALSVEPVNARDFRKDTRPALSGHIRASMRRSADGTQFLMWDNTNNRETWPNDTELTVDMTLLLPFEDLTPALQIYIHKAAGHQFQKGAIASAVLSSFTEEDVGEAMTRAEQEDAKLTPLNALRDSPSIQPAVIRHNPLYGK